MDTFLEEKLDDIDEFIQSELGFEPLSAAGVNTLGSFSQTREVLDGLAGNPGKTKIGIILKRCPSKSPVQRCNLQVSN